MNEFILTTPEQLDEIVQRAIRNRQGLVIRKMQIEMDSLSVNKEIR